MISVGSVSVAVVPNTERFASEMKAKLSGLTANLNLDTAAASAKIDLIRAKLDEIRGRSVRVDLDSGEAEAKVAAVKASLDSIHDKKINVDDGGSSNRVSSALAGISGAASFASAGVVLKTAAIITAIAAIIPIAAAASIAIAGIGAGIGVGLAGLLVGKLALGGVGGAFTAGSTPGQGGQASQQQAQAQQNITAAVQAHKQAVIQLAVAERDAAQAEKDLTQARLDAQTNLQNLTNAVADNELAQRRAALDVASSALQLKIAKQNPGANNAANAPALAALQLAYDSAKQQQLELSQAGEQASQAAAKANQLGVDGAQNVVAAQNKVVDTTNAVAAAQYAVVDSAQKVTLAQQAASTQTSAFGTALKKLDPAQKAFVAFLLSVKPALDTVKTAASTGFLPLLQQAIQTLLPVLPQIATIVGNIGKAFGELAVKAADFFTSPAGQKFLTFITNTIGPAIATFGKIFGGVFSLAVNLFQQAWPLIQAFGTALAGALGAASNGVAGGALGGFFKFITDNMPAVQSTLAAISGAIVAVFSALAPAAGPALDIVTLLANTLAGLAPILGPLIVVFLNFLKLALVPLQPILTTLVTKLIPPLETLFAAIAPIIPQLAQYFSDLIVALLPLVPFISQMITQLLPPWISFLQALINQGIGPLVVALVTALAPVLPVLAQAFTDILTALTPLIPILVTLAVQFIKSVAPLLPGIATAFANLAVAVANLLVSVAPILAPLLSLATQFFTKSVVDMAIGLAKAMTDFVNAIDDLIHGNFSGAFDSLKNAILDVYNVAVKPIVDGIKTIVDFFSGGGHSKTTPNPAAGNQNGGGTGGKYAATGARAVGGPLAAWQPSWVGERGAELFVPNTSGMVIPHDASMAYAAGSRGQGMNVTQNITTALTDPVAVAHVVNRHLAMASV